MGQSRDEEMENGIGQEVIMTKIKKQQMNWFGHGPNSTFTEDNVNGKSDEKEKYDSKKQVSSPNRIILLGIQKKPSTK